MAIASLPMIARDGTLAVQDGTGTPITLTLDYEEGNLSVEGLGYLNREVLELYDRDDLTALRFGRRRPIKFKFTCYPKALTDATAKLVLDLVMKTGAWASAVSTRGANEEVITYQFTYTVERTNFGATSDNTVTLKHCHLLATLSEEPGGFTKLEIDGTAYLYADSDIVIA